MAALCGLVLLLAAAASSRRRPLIYTRYSSDLQSDKSNEDQEREVRVLLRQKGIDDTDAFVIHDQAESGTTNDRPGFIDMQRLVGLGLVSVVAVDDQARASRNDDVIGVIKDLVFRGVRFLSRDGVDTNDTGWKTRVRLQGIHNAMSSEDTAHRVRRGMKGRVLDNKSVGDFPYGLASKFDDPEYAANYVGRGPKPTKTVFIYEPHAKWVRQIFEWVADGISFGRIALKLQELKAPVGRNVKRWTPKVISRLVRNRKYLGDEWTWGATTTIRDSQGRKKQVAAPPEEVTRVSRPDLRIIDADLWRRAQIQVARIDSVFGFKEGQKRRGFKVHFSRLYPTNILFKLLRCGACGAELYQNMSRELEYRQCKNNGPGPDDCRAKTRVPSDETKKVLTDFAADLLLSVPQWLDAAIAAMNDAVSDAQSKLPDRIEERRQQQRDLLSRRSRLFELIETGEIRVSDPSAPLTAQSSIRQRIEELDRDIATISEEIAFEEGQLQNVIELPSQDFITAQIEKLSLILRTDKVKAPQLLGELFDVVHVHRITLPGKQRGYHELKFRLKAWQVICTALDGQLPPAIAAIIRHAGNDGVQVSPEFCLNVGGPTRADKWTSYIVKRRLEGATWDEIKAETRLGRNTVRDCFNRHQQLLQASESSDNLEINNEENDADQQPDAA